MSKIILWLRLFAIPALAECPKPVQYYDKGQSVNCSGYLFSPEKELQLRLRNEEYKLLVEQTKLYIQQLEFYKKEVEALEKISKKQEEKVELWKTSSETNLNKYLELKEKEQQQEYIIFIAGIGTTLLTALSISQLTH